MARRRLRRRSRKPGRSDEYLLDVRPRGPRYLPDGIGVDRRIAPAENFETFLPDHPVHHLATALALLVISREKDHAHPIGAGRRQREAESPGFADEKRMRNLNENACAVPGLRVAAASAPVRQVDQNLNALQDNIVRPVAIDIRHETQAAGIVFLTGVIEPLWGG